MSLELELVGFDGLPGAPSADEIELLCATAAQARGVAHGHLAIEIVSEDRIAQLNASFTGRQGPTDVLSFPIDGVEPLDGLPRELGDVVICPQRTADLREAIVHGVLHLLGMDHETDMGEMLELQEKILAAGADSVQRAGFVALAGRPNVGKSTFLNAVLDRKVAIVSDKPQTTRRAIRGVLSAADCQIVFIDLPGVQRPLDLLTQRMAGRVREEIESADAALLLLDGTKRIGGGDRFAAQALEEAGPAVVIAVNKIDKLSKGAVAEALLAAAELELPGEIFPISARTGEGLAALLAHLSSLMPPGSALYRPEERSDQPLQLLIAELVREAAIRRTFAEVPHSVEVLVEEMTMRPRGLCLVTASVWVETDSQKRILVGAHGRMVKAIGTAARRAIEAELSMKVHLSLTVSVRRSWRSDEALLDRLGIS